MNVKLIFSALVLGASISLFSCKDQDCCAPEPGKYASGAFIVCEGPFGSGTGTVTWHNPTTGETEQDIFGKNNSGAVLGNIVQSLVFKNDLGFVVVNNANKIVVVNAETFHQVAEIRGFALPRHLLALNDQFALVSQWSSDGLSGQVMKVNLETLQIIDSVQVGHGPEKMYPYNDDKVLVPNGGGYGVDSTVTVINWKTMKVVETRVMPHANPCAFALPKLFSNSEPFVFCKGDFNSSHPDSWVGRWNNFAEGGDPQAVSFTDDLVEGPNGQSLLFSAGGKIKKLQSGVVADLVDFAAYGLGVDPLTGQIYAADAKDFSSAGEVSIFDGSGKKLGSFPTGVNPGEVVFR